MATESGQKHSLGWPAIVVLLIAVMAAIGIVRFAPYFRQAASNTPQPTATVSPSVSPRKMVVNPGYVGPQACAECHAHRVAEFSLTNHFRACREPQVEQMPAGFAPGNGHVSSRIPELRFEMGQTERDFFQTAILSTPSGDQRTTSRIDLAYGFPPTDEVYFSWRNGRLYELPVAWLHPQNQWGVSSFDPNGGGDFSRPLTPRCLECHNTWLEHTPGTLNEYRRDSAILGVTCERCHGPGREHVTHHRDHRDERTAHAILHPATLSRKRKMDLCAQCHSNAIKHRGPAFNYRPGEQLEDCYKTVASRHPEEDHVANQTKYLQQSRCFQQSETLTCISCHDPHKPHGVAERADSHVHSCLSCHRPAECGERSRLPEAVQNDCIGCHMPARNKIQVYFDTASDAFVAPVKSYEHRIAIYPMARQNVLFNWLRTQTDDESRREAERLSKELVAHWLNEAETRKRDYRFLAAIDAYREAIQIHPLAEIHESLQQTLKLQIDIDANWFLASRQIQQQRFPEAIVTLEKILQMKPDHAKVHGKLGTVYASVGQLKLAVEHLEAVKRLDPDDAYGEGMLGWMAYLDGRFEAAVEHYRSADDIEPHKAKIQFHWGLALAKLEKWDEAANHFRLALSIDPNHAETCEHLSQLLRSQGRLEEAIELALRAVTITRRQQPGNLLLLAELYGEAQRIPQAEQTASDALIAARNTESDLLPRIQRRLAEYRGLSQKTKR